MIDAGWDGDRDAQNGTAMDTTTAAVLLNSTSSAVTSMHTTTNGEATDWVLLNTAAAGAGMEWLLLNTSSTSTTTAATVIESTTARLLMSSGRTLSPTAYVIIVVTYIAGVLGNSAALYILHKESKTRYRNKKHSLMLRCLASNDMVGLLGMLVQLIVCPASSTTNIGCAFRVVWRGFGVSSGCLALVMAVERWLALTHPFYYQKNVTYNALLRAILACWSIVLLISCMPLLGFGVYYDQEKSLCKRYRDASRPVDIAYAYLFFTFGLVLAVGIAGMNLAVTRKLCHVSPYDGAGGRRIRRMRSECITASTPDEVAFARLMVALSITFLICWLPNLMATPLSRVLPLTPVTKRYFELADALLAIHFTMDPFVYVLLHHYSSCLRFTFDMVQRKCCCFSRSSHDDGDDV